MMFVASCFVLRRIRSWIINLTVVVVVVVVWENLPVSPGVFMLESIAASLAVVLTVKESEWEREREMKWTSSSRWAQDRTQNSSVNFSSSNPAPSLVLPRFVCSFRVLFFLLSVEDARCCCLVAGQTRSFTVRYRSASCRWRRTVSALNSWLLHTRCEVAYSSLPVETRGEADKIKTNEKVEMPVPLFSLSFHGLFLFPLTPCNSLSLSLSPVCPLPPPPSLSGCRVSFFQPHGAAHAKRGRGAESKRNHAHSPFVPGLASLRRCCGDRQRRPILASVARCRWHVVPQKQTENQ